MRHRIVVALMGIASLAGAAPVTRAEIAKLVKSTEALSSVAMRARQLRVTKLCAETPDCAGACAPLIDHVAAGTPVKPSKAEVSACPELSEILFAKDAKPEDHALKWTSERFVAFVARIQDKMDAYEREAIACNLYQAELAGKPADSTCSKP